MATFPTNLPKDVLSSIFLFLDSKTLKQCRLVCKYFLEESDKHIPLSVHEGYENNSTLSSKIQYFSNWNVESRKKIKQLFLFARTHNLVEETMFLSLFPNLITLGFQNVDSKNAESTKGDIVQFLQNLPTSILKLDLLIKFSNVGELNLPTSLTSLTIRQPNPGFTDARAIFLSKLPLLRKFCLSSSYNVRGAFLQYLSTSVTSIKLWYNNDLSSLQYLTRLKNLKLLDVTYGELRNKDIQFIPPSTRYLVLNKLPCLTREVLTLLPPYLEYLEIDNKDFNIDGIELPKSIKRLVLAESTLTLSSFQFPPFLKHLRLRRMKIIGEMTFAKFPSTLRVVVIVYMNFSVLLLSNLPRATSRIHLVFSAWDQIIANGVSELMKKFKEEDRHVLLTLEFTSNDIFETYFS